MSQCANNNRNCRSWATPVIYALLSAMLTLFASIAHADQDDELANTRFTPEEQRLIEAGFPEVDRFWRTKEFYEARDAILAVSSNDPLELPRLTDDGEGLFSRLLVELDNLTAAMEEWHDESGITEDFRDDLNTVGISIENLVLPIFNAYGYAQDDTTIVYEREALSLLPFLVRQMGLMAHMLQERLEAEMDLPDEVKDKFNGYREVQGDVTNAAINLLVNPGHRHLDLRAKLIIDCESALKELLLVLPEKGRDEAVIKLDLIGKFTKNQEEREAIVAILGKE